MALSPDQIPNDVESLKALLLAAHVEVDRLTARAERLDHIVSVLRRSQFGRRSERISDEQIELVLEDIETEHGREDAGAEQKDETVRSKGIKARRANRGHLPKHLPREEIIIAPDAKERFPKRGSKKAAARSEEANGAVESKKKDKRGARKEPVASKKQTKAEKRPTRTAKSTSPAKKKPTRTAKKTTAKALAKRKPR